MSRLVDRYAQSRSLGLAVPLVVVVIIVVLLAGSRELCHGSRRGGQLQISHLSGSMDI